MSRTTKQDNRVQEQRTQYTLEDCIYYINLVKEILTEETLKRLKTDVYHASIGRLLLEKGGLTEEQHDAATFLYEHHFAALKIFTTVLVRDLEAYERTNETTQSIQRLSLQDS